ncbi:pyridoxamine 5'-phosphate oxidase family protein [Vibrio sp. NH-UV-68]|uniref:2Fe-2S iron-sulfur cluster-binding protein n=1 Tax=unclassified Vibrio TaxID=2614977 RepID=UPI0036F2C5B1
MPHKYAELMFTDDVKHFQQEMGSRTSYKSMEHGEDYNFILSEVEASFIEQRDSVYMASVNSSGWPYVQHRGGPKGFIKVLDNNKLGFADFSGNRQYVSAGNFRGNNRVSLFFMDYPNQRRLKLSGRIEQVADDDWDTLAHLEVADYPAPIERAFIISVEAFDWNCPKYITPRFTELEISHFQTSLQAESKTLNTDKKQTESLGDGKLPLVVTGIRQLTPNVRAFEFRHRDNLPLPEVSAGAHLSVPITIKTGDLTTRRYSICSNPSRRDIYEIAVQCKSDGTGGSKAIYEQFTLGLRLNCEHPENYFEMHNDHRPSVLIAAGIGITPIKPMAQKLAEQGRDFELHYTGKRQEQMPFHDRLSREFGDKIQCYYTEGLQRLNCQKVLTQAPEQSVFYVCGPEALIDEMLVTATKLGINTNRIRYERFSAQTANNWQAFSARLIQSNLTVNVANNQTLLNAIIEEGVSIPSGCHSGECRSCVVEVEQGLVDHRDNCLTEKERQLWMCPCVSRAKTGILKLKI